MHAAWWLAATLVAVGLAGCTDTGVEVGEEPGPAILEPGSFHLDALSFASDPWTASDSFTGMFQFQDSQEFGDLAAAVGMEQEQLRAHDISALIPSSGLFSIEVAAAADPAGGDIDVWFEHDGTIRNWRCDCPFGGRNVLTGYGVGDGGRVVLMIQYDEVSSGPDDPDIAFQGFDYTLDVTVEAQPETLAPGIPFSARLEAPDDHILFVGHTSSVTVYGPDDVQVAVMEPDDGLFRLDEAMSVGEYVFIQQLDGAPYEAHIAYTTGDARTGRILEVRSESWEAEAAGMARVTFDAPATMIEVGGCAFAGDVALDPSFRMLDPDGEPWVETDSGGVNLLGWGVCYSNWAGAPDQMPGTWTLEYRHTASEGGELFWWTSWYVR